MSNGVGSLINLFQSLLLSPGTIGRVRSVTQIPFNITIAPGIGTDTIDVELELNQSMLILGIQMNVTNNNAQTLPNLNSDLSNMELTIQHEGQNILGNYTVKASTAPGTIRMHSFRALMTRTFRYVAFGANFGFQGTGYLPIFKSIDRTGTRLRLNITKSLAINAAWLFAGELLCVIGE